VVPNYSEGFKGRIPTPSEWRKSIIRTVDDIAPQQPTSTKLFNYFPPYSNPIQLANKLSQKAMGLSPNKPSTETIVFVDSKENLGSSRKTYKIVRENGINIPLSEKVKQCGGIVIFHAMTEGTESRVIDGIKFTPETLYISKLTEKDNIHESNFINCIIKNMDAATYEQNLFIPMIVIIVCSGSMACLFGSLTLVFLIRRRRSRRTYGSFSNYCEV